MTYSEELFDDIYPLWQAPWWQNYWVIAGIIIGVCLLITICWLVMRQWYKKKPLPAWQVAYQELAQLSPETDDFYVQLIIIFKTYCTRRYHSDMQPLTDQEFLAYLHKSLDQELCTLCTTIFEHSARARFAHDTIEHEIRVQDHQAALRFITLTTPQER